MRFIIANKLNIWLLRYVVEVGIDRSWRIWLVNNKYILNGMSKQPVCPTGQGR